MPDVHIAGVNSSKWVSFSPSHGFPDGYVVCRVSPVVGIMVFGAWHQFQPCKRTLIGSVWAIHPSLCTSHGFRQNGILLWASVGHGGNAERRLLGSSTGIMDIKEGVIPKGKECDQRKKKPVSTIYSHSPTCSNVSQPIPRVSTGFSTSSVGEHVLLLAPAISPATSILCSNLIPGRDNKLDVQICHTATAHHTMCCPVLCCLEGLVVSYLPRESWELLG